MFADYAHADNVEKKMREEAGVAGVEWKKLSIDRPIISVGKTLVALKPGADAHDSRNYHDEYECVHCHQLLDEAYDILITYGKDREIICCGHLVCEKCIKPSMIVERKACPKCGNLLKHLQKFDGFRSADFRDLSVSAIPSGGQGAIDDLEIIGECGHFTTVQDLTIFGPHCSTSTNSSSSSEVKTASTNSSSSTSEVKMTEQLDKLACEKLSKLVGKRIVNVGVTKLLILAEDTRSDKQVKEAYQCCYCRDTIADTKVYSDNVECTKHRFCHRCIYPQAWIRGCPDCRFDLMNEIESKTSVATISGTNPASIVLSAKAAFTLSTMLNNPSTSSASSASATSTTSSSTTTNSGNRLERINRAPGSLEILCGCGEILSDTNREQDGRYHHCSRLVGAPPPFSSVEGIITTKTITAVAIKQLTLLGADVNGECNDADADNPDLQYHHSFHHLKRFSSWVRSQK